MAQASSLWTLFRASQGPFSAACWATKLRIPWSDMLGIICALRSEAPRIGPGAVVAVSGPGRANAARAAEELAGRYRLSGLICAGYAGALAPGLEIGDLVIDTDVPRWKTLAARNGAVGGRVATVEGILQTVTERRKLAAETGAVAVDMESAAVAEVAGMRGLPFAAVRAITDRADQNLRLDWNGCRRADGSFALPRVATQALRSWRGMAEIGQLWYASRLASRSLANFLTELVQADGNAA